jgi:hypothetical protein
MFTDERADLTHTPHLNNPIVEADEEELARLERKKTKKAKKKAKKAAKSNEIEEIEEKSQAIHEDIIEIEQQELHIEAGENNLTENNNNNAEYAVESDAAAQERRRLRAAKRAAKEAKKAKKQQKKSKREKKTQEIEENNPEIVVAVEGADEPDLLAELQSPEAQGDEISIDFGDDIVDIDDNSPATDLTSPSTASIQALKALNEKLKWKSTEENNTFFSNNVKNNAESVSIKTINLNQSQADDSDLDEEVNYNDKNAAKQSSAVDEEFDNVWSNIEQSAANQPRKQLKPSRAQQTKEQPTITISTANKAAAATVSESDDESGAVKSSAGLHNSLFAKMNLSPTHAIDQYQAAAQKVEETNIQPFNPNQHSLTQEDDWNNVNKLREEQEREEKEKAADSSAAAGGGVKVQLITRSTPMNYPQALQSLCSHLSEAKLLNYYDFREISSLKSLRYKVFGSPKLKNPQLEMERNQFFQLATQQVDYEQVDHERMFQSIYRILTGDQLSCPTFGRHWELIGFQGADPATDIRGAGLLGLLQLLYLLQYHRTLALRIYALSIDSQQNFPFAVVSLNLTGIVYNCFRQGKLYTKINKANSVWEICNQLFVALFYSFFIRWKQQNCSIVNWSESKIQLENLAKNKAGKHNPFYSITILPINFILIN